MAFCARRRDQTAMTNTSVVTRLARADIRLKKAAASLLVLLSACSSTAPPPTWQANAFGSLETYTKAYLSGHQALSLDAFKQARLEVAQTGRPDLMARLELTRCALEVASLIKTDCPGFQSLAIDARADDKSYAAFLNGQWQGLAAQNLPLQYRDFFTLASAPGTPAASDAGKAAPSPLLKINNPLSQLVAAGILQIRGQLTTQDIAVATEAASAQGWRRPLLAWLGLQLQAAKARGDAAQAARIERRLSLLTQQP